MNADRQPPDDPADRNLVMTAFLLGWSVAETLGHLRKGVRPAPQPGNTTPDYAPRLDVSNGTVGTSTDSFVFAAERIVQFYAQLGFETGAGVSPLTQQVNGLPEKIRAWVDGRAADFYTQHALRDLFQDWTLQVWARLDAASADSARAFTAGLSLADTFWYMRPPSRLKPGPKGGRLSEEDFRRLLSKYRLEVARSRLLTLQDYFPRYVIPVIRTHLREWSIGTQVAYRDGRLVRLPGDKATGKLSDPDQAALQRALERQMQNWQAMLFGLRESRTYLLARDRSLIDWGRRLGLFVTLFATSLFLLVAAVVPAYFLSITLLPALLAFLNARNAGISDWLAVVTLFWTVLIAVPVPLVLRAAYQYTRSTQAWLDDQLTSYLIARRTLIPWDKYLKPPEQAPAQIPNAN